MYPVEAVLRPSSLH